MYSILWVIGGEARNLVLLYMISDPRRSRGRWWPERGLPELCRRRAAAKLDSGRRWQARPEMESARGKIQKHHLGAVVLVDALAGVGVAGRGVVAVSLLCTMNGDGSVLLQFQRGGWNPRLARQGGVRGATCAPICERTSDREITWTELDAAAFRWLRAGELWRHSLERRKGGERKRKRGRRKGKRERKGKKEGEREEGHQLR